MIALLQATAHFCTHAAGGSCATAHRRTTYTYDGLDRPTTVSAYSGPTGATLRSTWTTTYNANGDPQPASLAFDGRAGYNETAGTALDEGTDTVSYTYDAATGWLDQVRRGGTILTDYAYNSDGTVASRVDGATGTVTFGRDWAARVTSVAHPTFGTVNLAYRLDGLLAARALPGSAGTDSVGYDPARRPVRIDRTGGDFLARTYDRVGDVTSESRGLAGIAGDAGSRTQTFGYDDLRRVTGSAGLAATTAYAYDRSGNRTSATAGPTTTTYAYDRTDALTSQTIAGGPTTAFAYDTSGAPRVLLHRDERANPLGQAARASLLPRHRRSHR